MISAMSFVASSRGAVHALAALGLACAMVAAAGCKSEPTPAGVWDATIKTRRFDVPFKFDISVNGRSATGSFLDGDTRVSSSEGTYENGVLTLKYGQYSMTLTAHLEGDRLVGAYDRGTRGAAYPFEATRATAGTAVSGSVPSIAGDWHVALVKKSGKGEDAWRMIVQQKDAQVSAAIMRVDGDTGTMSGTYRDGKFLLGHFVGVGATVLQITPQPDGSLALLLDADTAATAYRADDARAKSAPAVTDPRLYTSIKDPGEKFHFSFPDLEGKTVSDADPRFLGKVVIVSITGTWCPNCHDEAPFLAEVYRTRHPRGLEIVALDFEEPAQMKDLTRVHGFIKQYGIEYPFLMAGQPDEAQAKIPQAINLNTFPATFVLGRDGRVRFVHAGYASKATGAVYEKESKEFLDEIDRLLQEPSPAPSSTH